MPLPVKLLDQADVIPCHSLVSMCPLVRTCLCASLDCPQGPLFRTYGDRQTVFFSVELLTPQGLVRCLVLFVIDVASRKVQIAGVKTEPDGQWMKQIARNLTQADSGFLQGKRYLIHDRDPLFTKAFDEILEAGGTKAVKTVRQSPNLNAFAERFVQSVKHECLNKMILTSEKQLEYVLTEYLAYYHRERPHDGLGGKIIDPLPQDADGPIVRFERLGGLLSSYRRKRAA